MIGVVSAPVLWRAMRQTLRRRRFTRLDHSHREVPQENLMSLRVGGGLKNLTFAF